MHKHSTKIRLVAAIGSTAVVALGLSPSSSAQVATASTPKRCQGTLISVNDDRYGIKLYRWACGRNGGIPLG